jgi:SpoU rRNA methylase family enzyme
MVIPKKKTPELELIEHAGVENAQKSEKVSEMENLVHNFDIQKIIKTNDKLRAYYKKVGDSEALELIDRMTIVMQELTEIINQVKSKRITLEQGQREIQEKLIEINEVLRTMKDWEATGL